MNVVVNDFRCKFCGSANIIRYGTFRGVQRWWCKDCKRKFVGNDNLAGMKTPAIQIASALSMYYGGMSLNAIRRHLDQQYNNRPSDSTVYEWLERFTKKAIKEARDYKPKVGEVWVADETVVKVGGKKFWLIDIIDHDTRFLLASRLSRTRQKKDIALLLRKAYLKAGKAPERILTDGWKVYPDAVDLVFGGDTRHVVSTPFVDVDSTNVIERFQGSLKDRTKVMRGLKKQDTAELLLDGWLIHYNFFRPHESLKDRTPAQKAGIKFPYNDWLGIVRKPKVTVTIIKPNKPKVEFTPITLAISPVKAPRTRSVVAPMQPNMLYMSKPKGGGNILLSRKRLRGTRVIKKVRLPATLSSMRG
jgi:putative transposase